MNHTDVSVHIFAFYQDTGKYLLERVSKIYNGNSIYLSLVNGNHANDTLIETARKYFDVKIIYVDNSGTDQYGFYHSFKYDNLDTNWIFYCHDKHISKIDWLNDMMDTFDNIDKGLLDNKKNGMLASKKHEAKIQSFDDLLELENTMDIKYRKALVESMHTLIWYLQLQRILFIKQELSSKEDKFTNFSAGNIFLIRRDVLEKAHACIYENFFNKGVYRSDGEVGHGIERFYFYVSKCMGYENVFK